VNELIEEKNQIMKKQSATDADSSTSHTGTIEIKTPDKASTIRIKAAPLPEAVTSLLENNSALIKAYDKLIAKVKGKESSQDPGTSTHLPQSAIATTAAIKELREKLDNAFKEAGEEWKDALDQIWSFGPRRCGSNVLLCRVPGFVRTPWGKQLESVTDSTDTQKQVTNMLSEYDSSFVSGFQLATLAGPLCEEPMMGVCFVVEDWTIAGNSGDSGETLSGAAVGGGTSPYGPFSGQVMSAVKEGCRRAFQTQPQRLMAAMYSCNIQVTAEVLGRMYAVLGRRGGRVLHGDMVEGSQTFVITAVLPVAESFAFAPEIRKQTSGLAMPQLVFSHWEVVGTDPFWEPRTEEEYSLYGEKADSENRALKYMNGVRRRKGLALDEKIVEFAEKQRTLTRGK